MRHEVIPIGDAASWTRALAALPHPPAHSHAQVEAFAASSPDETFLYVCSDDLGTTLVACPLAVRGESGERDVYTPYGFSGFASAGPLPAFAAEWDAFGAAQGWVASYVLQHPSLVHDLGFGQGTGTGSVTCFALDLTLPEDELLAQMATSRRQAIRRWVREPGDVTHDREEVLRFVLEAADDFFDAREAAALYRFTATTWERLLAAPTVWCIGVREGGGLVSANICAEHDGLVDGMFAISRPGKGAYSAPTMWEVALHFQRSGARTFNLGGGVRPDDGVAAFKRSFGAAEVVAPTLRHVHRRDTFAALCARAGVAPEIDGYFPPYRRRLT